MKKLLAAWLFLPLMGAGQQNVLQVDRYFPKTDKVLEFEKAMAAHVQKYHTGDNKVVVFFVETGPEAGSYVMVMGPKSWQEWDMHDMGTEHDHDFLSTIMPLVDKYEGNSYVVVQTDLSTVQPGDFAGKVSITHVFFKPGWDRAYEELLKKAKKAWEAGGESVAVSRTNFSGQPQFMISYRHKQGLKEKAPDFRKSFKDRFTALYGEAAFNAAEQTIRNAVERTSGEILTMRKDLSTP